jgi:hypothetical protein
VIRYVSAVHRPEIGPDEPPSLEDLVDLFELVTLSEDPLVVKSEGRTTVIHEPVHGACPGDTLLEVVGVPVFHNVSPDLCYRICKDNLIVGGFHSPPVGFLSGAPDAILPGRSLFTGDPLLPVQLRLKVEDPCGVLVAWSSIRWTRVDLRIHLLWTGFGRWRRQYRARVCWNQGTTSSWTGLCSLRLGDSPERCRFRAAFGSGRYFW